MDHTLILWFPHLRKTGPGRLFGCKRGQDLARLGRIPFRVYTRSAL